jgi:hypothetical protein
MRLDEVQSMKPNVRLSISHISLLFFSACSIGYDFVVINKSDAAAVVQYKLKRPTKSDPGPFVDTYQPAKLSLEQFEKAGHEWAKLSKGDYGFDAIDGTYTVRVNPDEALFLERVSVHDGNELAFDNLRIVGAEGTIVLEGRQVQTQFRYEERDYVLRYR